MSLNSNGSVIEHNLVVGNAEVGINVQSARPHAANRVSQNGDDIIAVSDRNVFDGNQVSNATGCEDNGCGFGITVEGGVGNSSETSLPEPADSIRVQPFEDSAARQSARRPFAPKIVRDAGR
jgi:hypothetical protein